MEKPIDIPTRETAGFLASHLFLGADILEVGCGKGHVASELSHGGYRVLGVDSDPEVIAQAEQRGVRAVVASWPDFDNPPVDAVAFTRSLHHITPLRDAVRRARELLRPSGSLLVEDFAFDEMNTATIRWLVEALGSQPGGALVRPVPGEFETDLLRANDPVAAWRRSRAHELHSMTAMSQAIEAYFIVQETQSVPYLLSLPRSRARGDAGSGRICRDRPRRGGASWTAGRDPPHRASYSRDMTVMDINTVTKGVEIKGERFPVVDVGAGPAVLFLHGFPDSRYLWRHQIPALVAAGFRVIAPDLRGFGEAPRPTDVRPYRRPFIVADVLGILGMLGVTRAHLIGHDWGASLTWRLAGSYPERCDRVVVLSVGAPTSPGWDTVEQREKSWYFDFFLKVGIAEKTLKADNWKLFREWSRGQGDQDRYLRDLARPGALTAALNWYRAALTPLPPGEDPLPKLPSWDRIRTSILGVWSDGDLFLLEPQMALSAGIVDAPWRYERITGAGHWMMLDKPEELNRLLVDFLK